MTFVSQITKQWLQTNLFYMFLVVFTCVIIPFGPFCVPLLIVIVVTNIIFLLKFIKSVYYDLHNSGPELDLTVRKNIYNQIKNKLYRFINTRTGEEFVLQLITKTNTNEQLFSLENITMQTHDNGVWTLLPNGNIKLFGKELNYQYSFDTGNGNYSVQSDSQLTQYVLPDKKEVNCHEKYSMLSFKYLECFIKTNINRVMNEVYNIFDFIHQLFQTFLNFFRPHSKDVLKKVYHRIITITKLNPDLKIDYTGLPESYDYKETTTTKNTTK